MYVSQASLALALLCIPNASSFLSVHQRQQLPFLVKETSSTTTSVLPSSSTTALFAKTKKKQKKRKAGTTTSANGGFGKVVEPTTKAKKKELPVGEPDENDDYAAFPALQDEVKQTLLPSNVRNANMGQDLSQPLYDRIGQIYGFENFNYPVGWFDQKDDDDGGSSDVKQMSFDDLLSSGSGSAKPASTSTDFSDLLGPSTSSTTSVSSTSVGSTDDISDLIASATGGETSASPTSAPVENVISSISNLAPFSKFRVLHVDPMILAVDDFMTSDECDAYVDLAKSPKKRTSNNDAPMMSRSKTVGKDSLSKAQRTSTTWFHHFKSVPELVAKATRLLGLDTIDRWEEPQTVRYQQSEKFTWHLDALAPSDNLDDTGGQRVATLLVYLTDIGENNGGSTLFRDLGEKGEGDESEGDVEKYLKVQPKKGSALLFFPAAGGIENTPFDIRTLHAGEALSDEATEEKWIAQMWLRENTKYTPTAPPGNSHAAATDSINEFCNQ